MCQRVNPFSLLLIGALSLLLNASVHGQGISFEAIAELTASPAGLEGRVSLELESSEPIYGVHIFARAQADKTPIGVIEYWDPGKKLDFPINLSSPHSFPGDYHLLIEVAFRDRAGAYHGVAMALEYVVGGAEGTMVKPPASVAASSSISVTLERDRLIWGVSDKDASQVALVVTTEPSWVLPLELNPSHQRIVLEHTGKRSAIPNWRYQQKGRLEWVQDNYHHSQVINWPLYTDANGSWVTAPATPETSPWWRDSSMLWKISVLMAVAVGLLGWRAKAQNNQTWPGSRHEEWLGLVALVALTLWPITHANPSLWLTKTWPTGGDVASQVFYAKVFMEWLPTGKISGWLPESFAGFPAFTFYFPLPFSLAGLLQFVVGQQVAFKLVSMLPAFLLPAATYVMGYSWGWRVPMRLLAGAGATAFILGGATSIWGGNVLAQLSGEFAYSWGFLFAVLFWASLAPALRKGGRWWLLAAALEVAVALSHGYALLTAGFGAFLYLLVSPNTWRDLLAILKIHLLAFLLIGFWLIPLIENLPWTIPNDGATPVGSWRTLWPKSLWPLMLGWIPMAWLLLRSPGKDRYGFLILTGICLLGLLGFLGGGHMGLADLRFFPYAQWALASAAGAALGWWLQQWLRPASTPLAVAALVALCAWWEPHLGQMENWSAWNLSGYESKATWPHYLATARANAGELHGPRLVFEHDPANNDLGSTRTLEALPMFGSRPALEGLYMESAVSGPFIYQLQAEISQRPSSPLSRFPSSARSSEAVIGHLNELYVDRLVLRSREKQAQFGADPRFELIAQHGPLQTYQFNELQTRLIEVASTPLVGRNRENWLGHAFSRYLVRFPYEERHVYLAEGEQLPRATPDVLPGHVDIKTFTRERLVFETDQPGQPHLIRMTYHPRWTSKGGETVYLTEPSFMLVYPRSNTVELVYGWSWGDRLGIVLSLLGIALFTWGLWRGTAPQLVTGQPVFLAGRKRFSGLSAVVAVLVLLFWWSDPEIAYQHGHRLVSQQDWEAAADKFDQAFDGRRTAARRSEALFWAARALDLGGEKEQAGKRYEKLRSEFLESYWYPESVFRLIEIYLLRNDYETVASLYLELVEFVPDNPWTLQAGELLGKSGSMPQIDNDDA